MLKDIVKLVEDLTIVGVGVAAVGLLTRPYKGFKRTAADAVSIWFITLLGGVLLEPHIEGEGRAYATAAVIGYLAPYIIDLVTTLLLCLTRDINKCDFAKVIQKRLGGKDNG